MEHAAVLPVGFTIVAYIVLLLLVVAGARWGVGYHCASFAFRSMFSSAIKQSLELLIVRVLFATWHPLRRAATGVRAESDSISIHDDVEVTGQSHVVTGSGTVMIIL